jgi:MFS family permease
MQMIATSWLVYRLTHSAFLLGLTGFIGQIPTFILAPFAGVIADSRDNRRILIITQVLAMLQAFILAFLVFRGNIAIWHIMVLAVFLGLVNAFDITTRQAFTVKIIEKKEDLGNAIALNSSMVNAARLIGPSIAGIIIAAAGEGACFLLNGISYLAVIFALLAIRIRQEGFLNSNGRILEGLKEGFLYAFGFAPIRYILLLLILVSFMGVSYAVLMPVFAREVFGGGPQTLGYLMGATGLGALAAAIYLARRNDTRGLEKNIYLATGIFGIGLISFSFSRILWLSLLLIAIAGFGMMMQMASSNILLQVLTHDDKRGRVMSFYTMAFMGMVPFGSLLAGALAARIGAPCAVLISGTSCILGAFLFAGKRAVFKG